MLTQKLLAVTTGGSEWILYVLIILSVCSVAVIIERFFALRGILNTSQKVGERAKEALKANDLSILDDLSRNHDAVEGRMLAHAIRHISKGGKSSEEIMNGYMLMEKQGLEKNLGFLATLGANAPFIGLLGTVLGIVRAFADLAGSQGNPSVVMAGISEALVATAVGLFVAIPAVVAYNYFQKQVKLILSSAESIKQLCLAYAREKGAR
ncbi:MAG: MotA/TolQ/ExbB proton channel family protein [Oligoflexia bacterium]|nr:MotA/TolQ/ExbB proton channel family protein [Oligoflexia bacterium]